MSSMLCRARAGQSPALWERPVAGRGTTPPFAPHAPRPPLAHRLRTRRGRRARRSRPDSAPTAVHSAACAAAVAIRFLLVVLARDHVGERGQESTDISTRALDELGVEGSPRRAARSGDEDEHADGRSVRRPDRVRPTACHEQPVSCRRRDRSLLGSWPVLCQRAPVPSGRRRICPAGPDALHGDRHAHQRMRKLTEGGSIDDPSGGVTIHSPSSLTSTRRTGRPFPYLDDAPVPDRSPLRPVIEIRNQDETHERRLIRMAAAGNCLPVTA